MHICALESKYRCFLKQNNKEFGCRRSTTDTFCTVGASGTRPRRGPSAALPGQACDGMLGTVVRIAPPQDCEARFLVDSSQRF
jgi:hypothetical protein